MSSGSRLLLIGLDGATWALADRFVAEGRMPVLGRLKREGAWAFLRSTNPPVTLPAWSTFLTGENPGRHGIFDFVCRHPGTYRLDFVNATWRSGPTLFRVLSDRGGRVACLGVPATWPPEKLNGLSLSGFDSPVATTADRSFCQPPELWKELDLRFGGFRFADFQELETGPGWHEAALESLLREIGRKEAIGKHFLAKERWDAFMLLFGESDTVAHHFWALFDEHSPRFRPASPALHDAIAAVYGRLDAALGTLVEAGKPDLLCLASDHGFGGAGDVVLYLNRFLEKSGFLRFAAAASLARPSGSPAPSWGRSPLGRLKGLALDYLPARAQEKVVRKMPRALLGVIESASRWGDVDFSKTNAFSDEMNYAATLHLNLAGRDPRGSVTDRSSLEDDLRCCLLDWEVDGRPVVRAVHDRSELYQGPFVERSPDLVLELELRDGYSYTLLPSGRVPAGTTWRRLQSNEMLGGKGLGMNGSHRSEGLLVLWGSGIGSGIQVRAGLADIFPTLLHLLGEPIPDHVDGRVLHDVMIHKRPAFYLPSEPAAPESTATGPGDASSVAQRLQSLGYL
jgi:predicted AlkP superfamily phosphohydrolase/phosphomutase